MSTSRYYGDNSSLVGGRGDKLDVKGRSGGYGKQPEFDSGFDSNNFCDSLLPMQMGADSGCYSNSFSTRPEPPQLMGTGPVDTENGDSGVMMDDDDDVERDCVSTHTKMGPVQTQPMDVDTTSIKKAVTSPPPRIANRSPPALVRPATKRAAPRLPKRTVPTPSFVSSVVSNQSVRTVTAPQRSPSPRSVFSQRHPAPSPRTTSTIDKENYGPFSLQPVRSTSPLTCNNFRSLNPERVPTLGVSIDIYQLREYVSFFLPDSKDGDTGFHLSVIHNQPDLLDKLLFIMSKDKKLKPVIDEQNKLYQTALHLATHLQQIESMRKLLIAGASINITDHKGNTPLHIAAKFSSTRPLEELIRYIPIQTILEVSKVRNNEGFSCIHIAAKNGNIETLRKLTDLGVNVDMQDLNSGKTALHLAVENTSLACVQFLLETCEANVNSLTYSGCSPLHVAAGRGDISIVAYLVSMGADPELYTDEGDIALDLAGSEQVNAFLSKAAALRWY